MKDTRESLKPKIDIYRKLSEAICEQDISALPEFWQGPDCRLECRLNGRKFSADGRYKVEGNALAGLLGGSKTTEYEIRFTGEIVGRRVFGEVERKSLSSAKPTLLGRNEDKKKFAIIFDKSLRNGNIVEDIYTSSPKYFKIESLPLEKDIE